MTEGLISAERKRFLASIIKDEVWSYAPASKDTHAKFGVDCRFGVFVFAFSNAKNSLEFSQQKLTFIY